MEVVVRVVSWLFLLLGCAGAEDDGRADPTETPPTSEELPLVDTAVPGVDSTGFTAGGAETCLRVNGGNDRVRSISGGMPMGAAPRTLQAWVRTVNLDQQVAVSIGLSAPGRGFFLGTTDGYLSVSDGGLPKVDDAAFVADGQFHHVAVTFDGRQADLYLDGVHGLRVAMDEVDTADGETIAGGPPTGGVASWVGWIDDVRIYERARSIGDMADEGDGQDYGLALWWDFEVEGSGPGVAIPDESGRGIEATTGGADGSPEFLPCR